MDVPPDNPNEWVRLKQFPPGFFEMMVEWTTTQLRRRAPAKRCGQEAPGNAIQSFFGGSRSELYEMLAKQPGAVTQRGFWNRLRSFFGGS